MILNKIFIFLLKRRLNNQELCRVYGYYINSTFDIKLNYFVENLHNLCLNDAYYIAGPYFAGRFMELINHLDKARANNYENF